MEEYKCECGRVFKSATSRNSHYRFCSVHIPIKKYDENGKLISKSKYKIDENLYKCECGKEFDNHQSLNAHFGHCDFHHECNGTKRKGHASEITKSMCWQNKTPEEIKKIREKNGKSLSLNIRNGKTKPSFKGRKHKQESIDKIRISTVEYITSCLKSKPRYNKKACLYIDNFNEKFNCNLQHAENGGEVNIDGYFPDGYDKTKNIVFEYDEPGHYIDYENNILKERDIIRQNFLMRKLGCRFIRYNEKKDYLYEVLSNGKQILFE